MPNNPQLKAAQQQQQQQQQNQQNFYTTQQQQQTVANKASLITGHQNSPTIINISSAGTANNSMGGGQSMSVVGDMTNRSNTPNNSQMVAGISRPSGQTMIAPATNLSVSNNQTQSGPSMSGNVVQQYQQTGKTQTPTPLDLLKCLRKFLHTLLDLASNSLPDKYPLVRNLIQDLLVGFFSLILNSKKDY